jgi:hypothetical protein
LAGRVGWHCCPTNVALRPFLWKRDRKAKRRWVQERRRVPDRALFERFPLYVVPTYPGDVELFATDGFRRWFPDDVPCAWRQIGDLMELG